jgi:hypothetical protein
LLTLGLSTRLHGLVHFGRPLGSDNVRLRPLVPARRNSTDQKKFHHAPLPENGLLLFGLF